MGKWENANDALWKSSVKKHTHLKGRVVQMNLQTN